MADAGWAPPETDFAPSGAGASWAPPETDFTGGDASAARANLAALGPNPDASMQRAHDIAMGITPATGPNALQQAGAVGEAALQAATGTAGALGGGISYLGTLAAAHDAAAAKAVQEAVQNATTYQPRLATTQQAEQILGAAAQKAGTAAVNYLSDKAAAFGGPTAGNWAATLIPAAAQAAPWLIPGFEGIGAVNAVPRAIERGIAREAETAVAPHAVPEVAPPTAAAAVPPAAPAESPGLAILQARPSPKPPVTAPEAAAATPAAGAPVVTHAVDEATGAHTVTATGPNNTTGSALAQESGPYLMVKRIDASQPGQGVGTAMLTRLQQEAQTRGLTLGTDVSTSPALQGAVDKMASEGYQVKENPNAVNPTTGNKVSLDPRLPVHEITAPLETPEATVASTPAPAAALPATTFTSPTEAGMGSPGPVPEAEQAQRAAVFNELGLAQTHPGAIDGDGKAAADAYQASKLNNEAGAAYAGKLQEERDALRNYTDDLVNRSGGGAGTDRAANYARGEDIAALPNAYRDYIEGETQKAYSAATAISGDKPFQAREMKTFIANNGSEFLGTVEGKQLLEGVQARMKDLGLHNDTGNILAAERMRQYLGNQWTPRTSRLIGALKDSLDDDVTKVAGADMYAKGRALRALRANIVDEPKGVSALLEPGDKLGINRQVALEDIPRFVERLPVQQFSHLVDVLGDAAKANPQLAPIAERSINGIRSQFANSIKAAGDSTQGMWNAKAVAQYLKDHEPQMRQVFTPEEMRQFKVVNDGGNWLAIDRSYPGAYAQGHNLLNKAAKGVGYMAEAAGAHAFGLPGYVAGRAVAGLAEKVAERGNNASSAQKTFQKVGDYLPKVH